MKICKKCGGNDIRKKIGCYSCSEARIAKWREKNKEKVKSYRIAWIEKNPEKNKQSKKEYQDRNPEKSAKWALKNPEKRKLISRNWQKRNPHKILAEVEKRRAKKLNSIPKWFGEFDNFVMQEAGELRILRKKSTGIDWHIDHTVPLQSKIVCGFHCANNISVIPAMINRAKGNRHWPDMP